MPSKGQKPTEPLLEFPNESVTDPPSQTARSAPASTESEQVITGALSFTQVAPTIVPSTPLLLKSFNVEPEPSEKL